MTGSEAWTHDPDGPANRGRASSRRWWVAAVVAVLIGAGCVTVGLHGHQYALPGPAPPTLAPVQPSPAATAAPAPRPELIVARSVPILLRVPAIGVGVSLSILGLNPDGTVQVPTDFTQPGWFGLGPSPGQAGSAVILGHVDSFRGPAVFFELRSLRGGDAVEVSLADGMVAHFVVTDVVMYSKTQFPAQDVYASHGYSGLQLVTCGGVFDRASGHYLSNIVAYTRLVAIDRSLV